MKCSLTVRALNFDFKNDGSNPSISKMLLTNNHNSLIKLLIGFRLGLTSLIVCIFRDYCLEVNILNGFNIQIKFNIKILYSILLFCKKHTILLFNLLTDITCLELTNSKFKIILIYSLLNMQNNVRLFFKVKTNEQNQNLLSVTSIYSAANWIEREIFDFFGLFFLFNKDLRRILLDYGFKGYPLKKDFPLSGYVEVFYDETLKKVTYAHINLAQEYRIFFYQKNIESV